MDSSMLGPGKYNDLLTAARTQAGSDAAILIVFGGNKGSGFSVQAPLDIQLGLPGILRYLADEVEREIVDLPDEVERYENENPKDASVPSEQAGGN